MLLPGGSSALPGLRSASHKRCSRMKHISVDIRIQIRYTVTTGTRSAREHINS